MPLPDPPLPVVFGRAEAVAAGLSPDQIARRLRGNHWTRLRRGQYHPASEPAAVLRWRAEIAAHVRQHRRPLVLSHAHAARAWDLPSPLDGWGPPSFTTASGSTRQGQVLIRVAPLEGLDVEAMEHVLVTSLARTVVDCARSLPGRDALAMADAALRSGRVTAPELAEVLARSAGWPRAPAARVVVARADRRRESPAESWSAWSFAEQHLPAPLWQVEVCDAEGASAGRVDAWWLQGVAGEIDGRAKYRLKALERGGVGAATLARTLDAERLREMDLRRTGALLVRWDPRDVLRPDREAALAEYLRALIHRAGGFTGRLYLS